MENASTYKACTIDIGEMLNIYTLPCSKSIPSKADKSAVIQFLNSQASWLGKFQIMNKGTELHSFFSFFVTITWGHPPKSGFWVHSLSPSNPWHHSFIFSGYRPTIPIGCFSLRVRSTNENRFNIKCLWKGKQ